MATHPIESVVLNAADVNKSPFKVEIKKYARDWGLAANFNTYDLPDVSIAVINGYLFIYDPLDLVTADDGVTCVHDSSGRRFKRAESEITGPGVSVDNEIPRWNGTSGIVLQQSGASIDDDGFLHANGFAFPATDVPSADPNTLDDYEEGTFTPSLLFGGAAVGMTYNFRNGKYTKIGNLVFINTNFELTAKGSSTGAATLSGLPFPSAAGNDYPGSVLPFAMASLVDGMGIRLPAASSAALLYTGAATGSVGLTEANFTNTSYVTLALVYRT